MTQQRQLQKSFQNLNPTEDNPATGYLGTLINGAYTIQNIHYPAQFYVRFPDHRFVSALHKGKVRAIGTFAASVEVEIFINSRGQWEIKGTAPSQSDAVQQLFGDEVYLSQHTHPSSDITDFSTAADARIAAANLDDLADVQVPTPSDGNVLTWIDADSKWENKILPTLVAISDAVVSNPPTDAELTTAFGVVAEGFNSIVDNGGTGTTVWHVVRKNSKWWVVVLTEAT